MNEAQRNGLRPLCCEPLRVEAQVEAREFLKKTGATYVVNTRAYLAAGRLQKKVKPEACADPQASQNTATAGLCNG